MPGILYMVATPIGNLGDLTERAKSVLASVDVVACEDTRRSLKLLNHLQLRKPMKSIPHFRERQSIEWCLSELKDGKNIAYISDAGVPGLCDPGSVLVKNIRAEGLKVEIIGGVSALTHFLSGVGEDFETFRFIGFLPSRLQDRKKLFAEEAAEPTIFFESPHRIESTLKLIEEMRPEWRLILAKELSKIQERFFFGDAKECLKTISSFKGEWIGAWIA